MFQSADPPMWCPRCVAPDDGISPSKTHHGANVTRIRAADDGANVTRTRAADDFATIRARIQELRRMTQPRAADDFATIRPRMEELRRERAQVLAEAGRRSAIAPRPYHRAASDGDPG